MTKPLDKLQELERDFPVSSIKVDNETYWPLFRTFIYAEFLKGVIMIFPKGIGNNLSKIRNSFFQFHNWFKSYDYLFFSNEMERKKINGVFIDKLVEGLLENLGYTNSLYIEQVRERHLESSQYSKKIMVSHDLILILSGIYKKIVRPGYKKTIEGEDIFRKILKSYNLEIDYRDGLDGFLSKVAVYKLFLKFLKPKAIIITDYGNISLIFASKALKIKVIEFQHGIIGHEHPYYQPAHPLAPKFCPDYILVFGLNDVNGLAHGNYVPTTHILPIGNHYINHLNRSRANEAITSLIQGYTYSICVPTDHVTHGYLVDFICTIATELNACLFFVSPREARLVDPKKILPGNVKFVTEFSFQEIVRHCDFNTSTNSTCCIEALALGAQNILIDEDGMASQYFGKVLTDKRFTSFVKSKEEYKDEMLKVRRFSRDEAKASIVQSYFKDYEEQLQHITKLINTLE